MSKKTYKELNNLVKSYQDKLIDNDFVHNVFEVMKASEPTLESFLQGITVENSPVQYARGNYNYFTRELSLYLNEFVDLYVNDSQKLDACIMMISHLIEHARSYRKFLRFDQDIESYVIKPCFNYDENTKKIHPEACTEGQRPLVAYLCSPIERVASIRSAEFFVKLVEDRKDPESLENAKNSLADTYLQGYINNGYFLNPPTYNYLIERKNPDILKELDKMVTNNVYDLYTRVLCGLPIKMEEITTIEKDFARVKSYLDGKPENKK